MILYSESLSNELPTNFNEKTDSCHDVSDLYRIPGRHDWLLGGGEGGGGGESHGIGFL